MFEIVFYENERGESDVLNLIYDLKEKARTSKDAKINLNKIVAYIDSIEEYGTRVGQPVTKHLDGDIWELRPLSNRILYAYYEENIFVLLHHFVKQTQKTPTSEIKKAKMEIEDYRRRHKNENVERSQK
ncbi:MAG: type II toxin-antitoxin system RelE/ParE family toxin [Lachnospiraceae bacterium]|nr:type II toxin-antitoxin system RelE/ParE family toxin [Lachnospiraceae bacterium]